MNEVFSSEIPQYVKTNKHRSFMKAHFYQYNLICNGVEYDRTQVDFFNMNPKEVFIIARITSQKIERHHSFKPTYARDFDFLKSLVCDFTSIDIEVQPVLPNHVDIPPLEPAMIDRKSVV